MKTSSWIFWIAVMVVVLAFIVPIRSLDCPAWDVWVTDQTGQPVSGVTVRLTCQNYSAERRPYETEAVTDQKGHVSFNPRKINKSLGQRAIATLLSAAAGTHASFGPHASVFAFSDHFEGIASQRDFVVGWKGQPAHMESHIVIMPRKGRVALDKSEGVVKT
ncbi:MAG TPA: hypothetical protein VJO35_05055 [Terriglobales bacterium]|nr:hypothetical protein [Terriglobales bacterium]